MQRMNENPDDKAADPSQIIADLQRELAQSRSERDEALAQQSATAEVLQVINASPGDLAPVFNAMLGKATQLCEAAFGVLWLCNGEQLHAAALHGAPAAYAAVARIPIEPRPNNPLGRMLRGERLIVSTDVADEEPYREGDPARRALVDLGRARSAIQVALVRDDKLLGSLTIYRQEVRPFSDKQIALLENFAAQAVIAIENARLINETREALDQQTATAEVLGVINSSPGNLTPVFDAILEKAHVLCGAPLGSLVVREGGHLRAVATRGYPQEYDALARQGFPLGISTTIDRLLNPTERWVQVDDVAADIPDNESSVRRAAREIAGVCTALWVPLRKDGYLLGYISAQRQEVRPFTGKQIGLLENFAAQAVIAMENARLINETREALEQQTATAEVLQVINSSPGDLGPVFDAMLEKATRLCEATYGHLYTYDGQRYHSVAVHGEPEFIEWRRQRGPVEADSSSAPLARIAKGDRIVAIDDAPSTEAYRESRGYRALVDASGVRSGITVALHKDDVLLGAITVYRQEVRPFSSKQIALLENFAAQAVIAMENARLITETREALDRQTATAEVLQVINSSPGDLVPVFQAILEKAHSLCDVAYGSLHIADGDAFRAVAVRGMPDALATFLRQHIRPGPNHPVHELLAGASYTMLSDGAERDDPIIQNAVKLAGMRTALWLPLRKDDALLGYIVASRKEARPFDDKQIALLQNFAAQAVIAMENARLINETREALDQQTATAEVLQVINASPGDLTPVFETILDKAHALCGAERGTLILFDGERFKAAVAHGYPEDVVEYLRQGIDVTASDPRYSALFAGNCVHTPDLSQVGGETGRIVFGRGGVRTNLLVPLFRNGAVLGMISCNRTEVRPFSDKEIALIRNFAAQAVIAMENARLLTETREALEQQTATAEVLQVINSSPGDLAPVFQVILEKAHALCDVESGGLVTYDDEFFRLVANHSMPEQHAENMRKPYRPTLGSAQERLLHGERYVQFEDVQDNPTSPQNISSIKAGTRTLLLTPLRKEGALFGFITSIRREVRPFSDKQITLLESFAAQAVIAMENARLITETREALEQQTATAEVLGVINSSPGNLQPVFDAILEKGIRLCEAGFGALSLYNGDDVHRVVATIPRAAAELFADQSVYLGPETGMGRLVRGESFVHIADAADDEGYRQGNPVRRALVDVAGARTYLAVPLRRDDALLGAFTIYRKEIRPFSDKQIALLLNFAAQAVIAMENARLLDEIRQRQAELRVTFDNMADGVVMFDADLRLAAWNKNFQEIVDMPDDFLAAQHSYDDYIRHLAARGEFGAGVDAEATLARYQGHAGEHYTFERTRPDGRVVEVRHNPMPESGFVLIYSDITERKRSETEIREARDAAEAALRDLKTAQASLIQAEKMASLGQLTAGIAHEIKNPLNFVNNFASLAVELLDELKETAAPVLAAFGDDKRAEVDETIELLTGNLERIAEHGKRADGIVKSMLEHSRGTSGERREVDLNNLVEEALNLAYHGARAQDQTFNITLERDFGGSIAPIELAPQEITRVFLNLFGNGFYAASKRGQANGDAEFRPLLTVVTRDLGDAVEVRIRDNGTGIPADMRDKLFQPFFTTKPTGEGTGLGLSISYDIVTQQHGGTIEVDSQVGEFTEFTIRLPRSVHKSAVA
jgi:PAS domain S-box-containing protein